jgi:cysteine desulfurase/selenocysteine lyase
MDSDRRTFLAVSSIGLLGLGNPGPAGGQPAPGGGDPASWRALFPALHQEVNGRPLAYLDNAATTHRPQAVIDALTRFYARDNANPSPRLHTLARRAAAAEDAARQAVARFLNAADPSEVVFTRGTTEGINLVAATWGASRVARGDEIVLTVAEHASNLLPWQRLAARAGARLRAVDVDDRGRVKLDELEAALTPRARLVAVSHVSNVLGLIRDRQGRRRQRDRDPRRRPGGAAAPRALRATAAAARASCYPYNTTGEIDRLADTLAALAARTARRG